MFQFFLCNNFIDFGEASVEVVECDKEEGNLLLANCGSFGENRSDAETCSCENIWSVSAGNAKRAKVSGSEGTKCLKSISPSVCNP